MGIIICYFIIYFIEASIIWFYASNLFISRYSKRIEAVYLSIFYSAQFVCFLIFHLDWLNGASFLLCNFLFILICYQIPWYSALFHAITSTIIMGMSELAIYSISSHFTVSLSPDIFHLRTVALQAVANKSLYFFIMYIICYILKAKTKTGRQNNKFALLLAAVPLTSFFIMMTLFAICESWSLSFRLNLLIAISSFLLLAVNLLVFSINSYHQRKNEEFTRLQISLQNESNYNVYYKLLLKEQENQSVLIHDIRNHLRSIADLNTGGQNKKIENYIKELMDSPGLGHTARFCNCELLNAILSRYQNLCQDKNILFYADIRDHTTDFISDNDMTVLFGNLLDNAYESASLSSGSFIEIKIQNRELSPFTLVSVSNACRTNPFSDTDHKLHTTKEDKIRHGYGIHSIERITHKYNGEIEMHYDKESLTFYTLLMLRQPE